MKMLRIYSYNTVRLLNVNTERCFGTSISFGQKTRSKRKEQKTASVDPEKEKCDCVGPPESLSNLRIMKYYVPPNETDLEGRYRLARIETNEFNKRFWAEHNVKFKKMKEEFIQRKLREKYGDGEKIRRTLSAEEMSQFYKKFLDDHRSIHMQYNREWYIRNFNNLILAARVWLQNVTKKRR